MSDQPYVIFLSGPIGVGKTTLGIALADALKGRFIEGDDHAASDKPWYASSHSTARSILSSVLATTGDGGVAVVAYPLRCLDWLFYRKKLADQDVIAVFVSLAASFEGITSSDRGRKFSEFERQRIKEMLVQGYAQSSFSDTVVRTDNGTINTVLADLLAAVSHHVTKQTSLSWRTQSH